MRQNPPTSKRRLKKWAHPFWKWNRTDIIGISGVCLFFFSFFISKFYWEQYAPWRKAAYETAFSLDVAQSVLEKTMPFKKEVPMEPEAFQDNLLRRADLYQQAFRRPLPLVDSMPTVDGWGHPFQCRTTTANSVGIEVFSVGQDGQAGTRDDLPSKFNPAVTPPHFLWWKRTVIAFSAASIFTAGVWAYLVLAPLHAITALKYSLILFAFCFLRELLFPPLGGVMQHTMWNWLMTHLFLGSIVCILGILIGRPIRWATRRKPIRSTTF